MPGSIRERLKSGTIWLCLGLVSLAIIAATLGGAVFISDGAYFLLTTINDQQVHVPHLRITFSTLLYPAALATRITDDLTIIRYIYSISLMFTPIIALALSWWVVRHHHRSLFLWAAFGILLVNLPGQMHWVATSIRTNQLFWPLLLAVLIGMPGRVVPMAVILAQLMVLLHPHAAAYFIAGSLAALWIAWSTPEIRSRMLAVAGVGGFYAFFRLLIPSTDYESSTSGIDYQLQLLERSIGNWAGIGLLLVAIAAVALAIIPRLNSPPGWIRWIPLASLILAGSAFLVWAADGEEWRNVSDYRGANLLFSLLLMGLAFLDSSSNKKKIQAPEIKRLRRYAVIAGAVVFGVTISLQSYVLAKEVNRVSEIMEHAGSGCIPESQIPDFESSPLWQSTFPSTSLLLQSRTPDRIVLPDSMCDSIADTGHIPMFRTPGSQRIQSGWIDLWSLQYSVAGSGQCWVNFNEGWHARESGSDGSWGRWSQEHGTIRLTVDEAKSVMFTVSLRSFIPDNTVTILLHGEQSKEIPIGNEFQTILPVTLELQPGDNWLELRSSQDPQNPPKSPDSLSQDPRTMTFMIWDPSFSYDTGDSECIIR